MFDEASFSFSFFGGGGGSSFISPKTRKSYKINGTSPEQLITSTKQTYTDWKQPNKSRTLLTIVKPKALESNIHSSQRSLLIGENLTEVNELSLA